MWYIFGIINSSGTTIPKRGLAHLWNCKTDHLHWCGSSRVKKEKNITSHIYRLLEEDSVTKFVFLFGFYILPVIWKVSS